MNAQDLKYKTPLILDIKKNSLDDGPGIRSVIFLKGCPLSCLWCHNPEGIKFKKELSFDLNACIKCDGCILVCPENALSRNNKDFVNRQKCSLCMRCVEVCPAQALAEVGVERTIEELVDEVFTDDAFFKNSGGGVTLSGGEATQFPEFAGKLLKAFKAKEIHTLLQTNGLFNYADFKAYLCPYLDLIYFDVKIFRSEKHEKFCGVNNRVILKNFTKIFKEYLDGGVEVFPRVPLVPGITAKPENLREIADFFMQNKVEEIGVLDYNLLWSNKAYKLGIHPEFKDTSFLTEMMSDADINACQKTFLDAGFQISR